MPQDKADEADKRAKKAGADVVPRPLLVEPEGYPSYKISVELQEETSKKFKGSDKPLLAVAAE